MFNPFLKQLWALTLFPVVCRHGLQQKTWIEILKKDELGKLLQKSPKQLLLWLEVLPDEISRRLLHNSTGAFCHVKALRNDFSTDHFITTDQTQLSS